MLVARINGIYSDDTTHGSEAFGGMKHLRHVQTTRRNNDGTRQAVLCFSGSSADKKGSRDSSVYVQARIRMKGMDLEHVKCSDTAWFVIRRKGHQTWQWSSRTTVAKPIRDSPPVSLMARTQFDPWSCSAATMLMLKAQQTISANQVMCRAVGGEQQESA